MNKRRHQTVECRHCPGLPLQHSDRDFAELAGSPDYLGVVQQRTSGVRHGRTAMSNQKKRVACEHPDALVIFMLRQTPRGDNLEPV
jgi:hypothetical protein